MDYCRADADGLRHLFRGFDLGAVCVCGRKRYGYGVHEEEAALLDHRSAAHQPHLIGAAERGRAHVATPELAVVLGGLVIQHARQTRRQVRLQRAAGATERARREAARGVLLGVLLCDRARQARRASVRTLRSAPLTE